MIIERTYSNANPAINAVTREENVVARTYCTTLKKTAYVKRFL